MVEDRSQQTALTTNYTFAISLLHASGNDPADLQVQATGALTLDTSNASSVTGVLTIPTLFEHPVSFTGTMTTSPNASGLPVVFISERTATARIQTTFSFGSDGWSYNGTYLSGMAEVFDETAWAFFILQGLSPPGQGKD